MVSNKKLGNDFEAEFCERLSEHDFWVHNMAQNTSGQPADVIAVKGGKAYLIDCKECTLNEFQLDRIEDNQHLAMNLWRECNNGEGWFALKVKGEIIMIPHVTMAILSGLKSTLHLKDIQEYGVSMDRWLRECT